MAHGREDFTYLADADITAQTIGNLAVNIVAQTLSQLDVNITAQDLAELTIKIIAQSVGVYVERDWATTQNNDKSLTGSVSGAGVAWVTILDYTPGAGKVLYIDDFDYSIPAETAEAHLKITIDGTVVWQARFMSDAAGKSSEGLRSFTTPKKALANEQVLVQANYVGANRTVTANLGCREYSV